MERELPVTSLKLLLSLLSAPWAPAAFEQHSGSVRRSAKQPPQRESVFPPEALERPGQ